MGERASDGSGVTVVLPAWRPLNAAFLALTVLSTVSLFVLADRTDQYFAWTINPPLTAAFLGGGYAAGFVLVVLTMRERVWARARIAYATGCVFVWVTLLAPCSTSTASTSTWATPGPASWLGSGSSCTWWCLPG
jgi:hypothetical protein